MDIKMLALDLDGTLTNRDKIITPRTRAALEAAMKRGVRIVLASGRPPAGIESLAKELHLAENGGFILAYNGGQAMDCRTGKTLYQKQFPPEYIVPACTLAAQYGAGILSYDENGVISEKPDDPWVLRECAINKIPICGVKSLPAALDHPVCKLLMAIEPEKMPPLEAAAEKMFAGKIDTVRSCAFFLEIMPKGVAKDTGLAALCAAAGISQQSVMACGDGMNDLPMIRWAGVGVAMANADAGVKPFADYVTAADNDHDGVAEAVEKYILK